MTVQNVSQSAPADGQYTRAQINELLSRSYTKDYVELKKMLKEAGIFDRQYVYYAAKMGEVLLLHGISFAVLFMFPDMFWVQMINAVLFGFASTMSAYVVHDAGHRQIFRDAQRNDIVGIFFSNFMMGASSGWWIDYHNEHHAHPNELETDPAIDLPFWAFDDQTAIKTNGFWRFMVKNQAYFYFPLMLLQGFFLRVGTFEHFTQKGHVRNRWIEITATLLHFVWYFTLLFTVLEPLTAVAFIIVHHMMVGVHLGAAFAPNHKGMPTIEKDQKVDFFIQQTITTRNVRPSVINDYLYGGLNYQIEHHLFPGTPRNKLGEARQIIMGFCQERGIPYHETGAIESYRELLSDMHRVGKTL